MSFPEPIAKKPITNFSDFVQDLAKRNAGAIKIGKDILNAVSGVIGVANTVESVISLFEDIFGVNSPHPTLVLLQDILDSINSGFEQLRIDLRTDSYFIHWTEIDQWTIPSETALFQIIPSLEADPPIDINRMEEISTCLNALMALSDLQRRWRVVYDYRVYYSDHWSGKIAPPPCDDDPGAVFYYTYILPLLIHNINILLSVVEAYTPNNLHFYYQIIRNCVAALTTAYYKIHDNIVSTKVPDITELIGPWHSSGQQLYGAVERYSGYHSIGHYPPVNYPGTDPLPFDWAKPVTTKLRLRIRERQKNIYHEIGLADVFQTINNLNSLIGDAPLNDSEYFGDWSLREAFTIMDQGGFYPPNERYPYSLRDFANFIKTAPPTLNHTPTSLREMLEPTDIGQMGVEVLP